jgi:hypothetical protein
MFAFRHVASVHTASNSNALAKAMGELPAGSLAPAAAVNASSTLCILPASSQCA